MTTPPLPLHTTRGIVVRGNPPDKARLAELAARARVDDMRTPEVVSIRTSMIGRVGGCFHNKPATTSLRGKRMGRPAAGVVDLKSGQSWPDAERAAGALILSPETVRRCCSANRKRVMRGEAVKAYADLELVWGVGKTI